MSRVKKTYLIWTKRLNDNIENRVFAWGGKLGTFKVPDEAEVVVTLCFSDGIEEEKMHRMAAAEIIDRLKVNGILFGGTVKWAGGRRRFTITEGK